MRALAEALAADAQGEVERVSQRLREILAKDLHKRGLVVAISGGVDSAVCTALSVQAVGPKRVFGLLLPERDSSPESLTRGMQVVQQFGIGHAVQDIAPALEAIGCYRWRDEAIKEVFPEYGEGWRNKIAIRGGHQGQYNHFELVVQTPDGEIERQRLPLQQYLQIIAASNYKQRLRKAVEYFHADRLNYAVIGTPNRLEYDQGFFVKNGDGAADIKPIAHLYKTQVYALAEYLGLPAEIRSAAPSTDTYSMEQGQDEFYFRRPYDQMDVALWARNHEIPPDILAKHLRVSADEAEAIYRDIEAKRATTRYQHSRPVLLAAVPGAEP